MTTQQEAVKKFIEATKLDRIEFEDWPRDSQTAFETLRTALAQQGEQPVAYITDTEQGPMVWTPEMYDEACTYCDDGEFPVPLYTVAPRPTSGDYALGYAEGFNDACKPAPQPAQGEPTGCACRWDADDNRVATCERHQGWLDVVHEWAERAKAAEKAREE